MYLYSNRVNQMLQGSTYNSKIEMWRQMFIHDATPASGRAWEHIFIIIDHISTGEELDTQHAYTLKPL